MNKVDDPQKLLSPRIGVRLSVAEHARLTAEAAAHGVTLSKFVRAKLLGAKITSRIDAQAVAELRRQGGLLKHLASTKERVDSEDIRATLDAIKKAVLRLGS